MPKQTVDCTIGISWNEPSVAIQTKVSEKVGAIAAAITLRTKKYVACIVTGDGV
jgi:hypothetical protein